MWLHCLSLHTVVFMQRIMLKTGLTGVSGDQPAVSLKCVIAVHSSFHDGVTSRSCFDWQNFSIIYFPLLTTYHVKSCLYFSVNP